MSQPERIQQTIDAMTSAFRKGDIDAILRTYEPGAVVVGAPGVPLTGTPRLRAMFARFVALRPTFTFLDHEIVQAGDLALHLNKWRMTGTGPDGSTVEQAGLSVVVLRRQDTGEWLMVIDDPFGDWIQPRPSIR